ncbi:protein-disulfide reductase DsbD [Methylococcus capsulatus]|uniref:protein-disulfide reductase DsbD n=2 Tax=Methylococcus capsulatus TaxID=414 RepID=UPI00211AAEAD|nr:protein-disulfide reductase DsbD [Methylococcus capsulatus]
MGRIMRDAVKRIGLLLILGLLGIPALAIDGRDLLPPERAFPVAARQSGAGVVSLVWDIADGYYLYRSKFKFASRTPGVRLGEPVFPEGHKKHDAFFGEVETYRGHIEVRLPLVAESALPESLELEVTVQGCADAGVCFPPYQRRVEVKTSAISGGGAFTRLAGALRNVGTGAATGDLLPPDQAFRFFAEAPTGEILRLGWQIAPGYYLYREKFRISLRDSGGVTLGDYTFPRGEPKVDEEFGAVEVFHGEVAVDVPLVRTDAGPRTVTVEAGFQGCAERGVCYPPMTKTIDLVLPAAAEGKSVSAMAGATLITEQDRIADGLWRGSLWLNLLSFLGLGILLAFTPCIFPMIPILSGVIVGHGHAITTRRAFSLSLAYVLAHALAYTCFGVLAALFGANLQVALQNPWAIGVFSGLFVVLALSMFGFYQLQLPTVLQSRLAALSSRQQAGSLVGAAVMGLLSAGLVGPCVAAPLAGALIYIGRSGDVLLGGLALFSLGLGMGLPLLAVGTSAGKLLPKAGMWMNTVKSVFGVAMVAVAVSMLERIVPLSLAMLMWALLLIVPAVYMGALDALPAGASGWRKLWKGLGVAMVAYGVFMLLGVAAGSRDPLQPLRGVAGASATVADASPPPFVRVASLADLEARLAEAAAAGRWVMLDFYADWCVSCKEMERHTFSDPVVKAKLKEMVLLKADVTENDDEDQALLQRFGLIGPPATLFFGPDRSERKPFRLVGFTESEEFVHHLERLFDGVR